jgi:hypothetical protein
MMAMNRRTFLAAGSAIATAAEKYWTDLIEKANAP